MSKSNIIIILLVALAVALGFLIYSQFQGRLTSAKKLAEETPSEERAGVKPPGDEMRRPTPGGLTEDEKILFNPPPQGASEAEIKEFRDSVRKLAKKTSTLNLSKCEKPSPLVIEVEPGSEFKVQNSDSVDHTLYIRSINYTNTIPAGQTKAVKADDFKIGSHGYSCDGLRGVVGYIIIARAEE
jgi:hypothetical protein